MARNHRGLFIGVLSVFAALLFLLPGRSAQAVEDNTIAVVGGIIDKVKIIYSDFLQRYIPKCDYPELMFLDTNGGALAFADEKQTSEICLESSIKTPLQSEPEVGKDYYFRTTIGSFSYDNQAYDFSQIKPENCRCILDGYTTKCIKVIVEIVNPIQEGERDSVDLVFQIRKKEKEVQSIQITGITEPAAGAYPDYSASSDSEDADRYHVYQTTGAGWRNGVTWWDRTTNSQMGENTSFQAGHTYRCAVLVTRTDSSYEFANDGTKPTVSASIDGKQATAYQYGDYSIRSLIGIYRDYTIPAPQQQTAVEISVVDVEDVTPPRPGAEPSYSVAAPSAADYSVWTDYETEYRKSGVLWYDMTDKRYISPDETFTPRHWYEVSVYLIPDIGYVFATLDDGRFDVSAMVNGNWAEVVDTGDDTELEVTYQFECSGTVDFVSVDMVLPAAGAEPDWNMTAAGPGYEVEDYTSAPWIKGVYWKDDTEDRAMKEGDRFVAGHTYTVTVSVVTEDGWEFGDYQNNELTSYLGGVHPDETIDWNDWRNNIGLVRTFTVVARLPGDANADGKVDMKDALTVVQYVKGTPPVFNYKNADVNGDGWVNILDARLIGQYAAGWNVELK